MAEICAIVNLIAMFFLKKYDTDKPLISDPEDDIPHERTRLIRNETTDTTETADLYVTADEEEFTRTSLSPLLEDDERSEFSTAPSPTIILEEISCFQSITSYLLALNMFATVGVGLMYTNNVGTIIHSIADADASVSDLTKAQAVHVSLLSLLGFSSRILIGFLADFCNSSIGLPFTFWAILSSFLMGLSFYISTYVIGFLMKGEFFAGSFIC
jgi:hypothetical protein